MKKQSLYNRFYDHSFSLLLSFSFYALLVSLLLSCEDEENIIPLDIKASSTVTDLDANVYTVGYVQQSRNNQDAIVEKRDSDGNILWKVSHAASPADERATLVVLDHAQNPWIIFTVDGGSYSDAYITKKHVEQGAFENVYQNSYGKGGGPKVAVIARLNPEDGRIMKASFLTARLNSGNTNSLTVENLQISNELVELEVKTSAWPPAAGTSYRKMPDITDEDRVDNAFLLRIQMDSALSEILDSKLR